MRNILKFIYSLVNNSCSFGILDIPFNPLTFIVEYFLKVLTDVKYVPFSFDDKECWSRQGLKFDDIQRMWLLVILLYCWNRKRTDWIARAPHFIRVSLLSSSCIFIRLWDICKKWLFIFRVFKKNSTWKLFCTNKVDFRV